MKRLAALLGLAGLALAQEPFSPNGDGKKDAATLTFQLEVPTGNLYSADPSGAYRLRLDADVVIGQGLRTISTSFEVPLPHPFVDDEVAARADANDNAKIPLTSSGKEALKNGTKLRVAKDDTLTLPAGDYYFTKVDIHAQATVILSGKQTWWVAGNVSVNAGAKLNAGGDPRDLWIVRGGCNSNQIALAGVADAAAVLYAPESSVRLTGASKLTGAVVGRDVLIAGGATLAFSPALLEATTPFADQDRTRIRAAAFARRSLSVAGNAQVQGDTEKLGAVPLTVTVVWDGKDDAGQVAAEGLHFAILAADLVRERRPCGSTKFESETVGSIGPTDPVNVLLDLTPPVLKNLTPPPNGSAGSLRPVVSAEYLDALSGIDLATVNLLLDGADVTAQSTVTPAGVFFQPAEDIAAGTHAVEVRVSDHAANEAVATWTFSTDSDPPEIALSPADGEITTNRTPTLAASYSDAGVGVDLATFAAALDGQAVAFGVGPSQATFEVASPLADGPHTLSVTLADKVGNVGQATSIFRVVTAFGTIGAGGGSLSADDGSGLVVPAGALDQPTVFTLEHAAQPPPFPPGFVPSGAVVDLLPSFTFAQPVTVRIAYDPALIPAGVPETGLKMLKYDLALGTWVLVPILSIDVEANVVTTEVTSLDGVLFGVAGQVVDAQKSVVTADPLQVSAEGISFATVVITPRDIEGRLLGPNQAVSVAVSGVGSASPVLDLGNGVYQAFAVSGATGTAKVLATVNGTPLASQPEVVFVEAFPDFIAIEELTSPVEAGQASSVTLRAKLSSGAVLATFTGTVEIHLTGTAGFYPDVFFATFTADGQGVLALPNALVFARAGVQQVRVLVVAKPDVTGFAQVIVQRGPPAILAKVAGDGQKGAVATLLPQPLVVKLTDLLGNPVEGATVDFSVASGGAVFATGEGGAETTIDHVAGGLSDGLPATEAPLALLPSIFGSRAALSPAGDLYVTDTTHHVVRKIGSDGKISTVVGTGIPGFSGDGGPAISARLSSPIGIAVDSSGNLWIGDLGNSRIRKVGPDGLILTAAGGGSGNPFAGGDALGLRIEAVDLALDSLGRVYVLTTGLFVVRLNLDGTVERVAGTGFFLPPGDPDFTGDPYGGPAKFADTLFCGITLPDDDTLLLSDCAFGRLARVDLTTGILTQITTTGSSAPGDLDLGPDGSLYWMEPSRHVVFRRTPSGIHTLIFAGQIGTAGYSGDGGPASSALLSAPTGLVAAPDGRVFIVDSLNHRVRVVSAGIIDTLAGNGARAYGGEGGPAANATFSGGDIAEDSAGNLYLADTDNHRIRKIDTAGVISTIAGDGTAASTGDGGPAAQARVASPHAVVVDSSGTVYFAQWLGGTASVRRISSVDGTIATIPGSKVASRDPRPFDLALDLQDRLYISELPNHRVRKYSPADGSFTVVAGTGTGGFTGDGGPATLAQLRNPGGVAVDGQGNVWIADTRNKRIRRVSPTGIITSEVTLPAFGMRQIAADAEGRVFFRENVSTGLTTASLIKVRETDGTVSTIAGNGEADGLGDGGPAAEASILRVEHVSLAPSGRLLLMELPVGAVAGRIREIVFGAAEPAETFTTFSDTTNSEGLALSPRLLLPESPGTGAILTTSNGLSVAFTVEAVQTAPQGLAITSPENGATVLTATPVVSGTAPLGTTVVLTAGGIAVGETLSTGAWSLTTAPLGPGAHTLVAYAVDTNGVSSKGSAPVEITVSLEPPQPPTIATPHKKTNDPTPFITGAAAPLVTVVCFADGLEVGSTFSDATGAWSLSTAPLTDGVRSFTARTQSSPGVLSDPSPPVLIAIDTVPPDAPSNLVATAGNGIVRLQWDRSLAPDTLGYHVWRKSPSDPDFVRLNALPVLDPEYCDATVQNGVQYRFRVSAVDDAQDEVTP